MSKGPRSQTAWQAPPPAVRVPNDVPSSPKFSKTPTPSMSPRSPAYLVKKKRTQSTPYKTSAFYDDESAPMDSADPEIQEFLNLWEEKVKKWEVKSEWIEVRETLTGKIMWYNQASTRLVFDTPPNVEVIQLASHPKLSNADEIEEKNNRDYFLNRSLSPMENEDIVAGLVNFEGHRWNFNEQNRNMYNYRKRAAKKDHLKMLAKAQQYVFPEYFSLAPFHLIGNKFLAKIRLPQMFSKNKKYSFISVKVDITKASDVIKAGVNKLDAPFNKSENPKEFILKVVGQEAYIYGKQKIIEYEAVRDALRNEDDVEFVLLKRPDFKTLIAEAKVKQSAYTEEFQAAYNNLLPACSPRPLDAGGMQDYPFDITNQISLYEFEWHYRIKIEGLQNVTALAKFDTSSMKYVYVVAELWHGDTMFDSATLMTRNAIPKSNIRWGEWLSTRNLLFSQMPRECVLCFMVMGVRKVDKNKQAEDVKRKSTLSMMRVKRNQPTLKDEKDVNAPVCLGWARLPLIDNENRLRHGQMLLNLWSLPRDDPYKMYKDRPFRFRGTTADKNLKPDVNKQECQLLVTFDQHPFYVIAPKYSSTLASEKESKFGRKGQQPSSKLTYFSKLDKEQEKQIAKIIRKTPLEKLNHAEKQLIWHSRDHLWHDPNALSAFLRSTNWANLSHVIEAHKYIDLWTSPKNSENAIEFLDYKYMDTRLREKAIKWLDEMDDSELNKYLLQLIQCLKYELHHDNALCRFLIRRALKSPYQVGHYLFWHLKCEYEMSIQYAERFALYIEEYLLFSCEHKRELFIQHALLKRLEHINKLVLGLPHKQRFTDASKKMFRKELSKLNFDLPSSNGEPFKIPLYPRWKAMKLKVEKCKYMSSKQVPLWLVFENADDYAEDIVIMFKYGDDLRQDMLTIQMINIMDRLWLNKQNMDLHLKPYKVLATGNMIGMIQIVGQAYTVNNISEQFGGVFNDKTIDSFIKKYNSSKQSLETAQENFAKSCAGYCIATYVLGVSDRHASNYMVTKNGQFFHIDFGHFLGNWKTKWGIKREGKTPFVFTSQMRYAIGNAESKSLYKEFLSWCVDSYLILRENNRLLLVLFILMISAGLEELVSESDIMYFQNALNLNDDDKKARKHVEKQIDKALNDWGILVNNKIHQWAHKDKK